MLGFAALALAASLLGQAPPGQKGAARSPLNTVIERFDVTDAIVRDALSELSLKKIEGLHLGFEEIIRDRIQEDPRAQSPVFSMHLQGATVREVLDELCRFDLRYTWAQDGATVNVYPRATINDRSLPTEFVD